MFIFISAVVKAIREKLHPALVFMVWGRDRSAAPAEEVVDGCHTKSNSMLSNTLISLDTRELVAVTFGNLDLSHHQNTAPIHME